MKALIASTSFLINKIKKKKKIKHKIISGSLQMYACIKVCKGVGVGGGGAGDTCPPLSKVGGHKWVCIPPLLGRANVLIALFAHILWLKTQFFQNFLGSLRSPTLLVFSKSIFAKFC